MIPKTNIMYFWRHQDPLNSLRKTPNRVFGNLICINLNNLEIEQFEHVGKGGGRQIPTIRLINYKILNMGAISWDLSKPLIILDDLGILVNL